MFESTVAVQSSEAGFHEDSKEVWVHKKSGCKYLADGSQIVGAEPCPAKLTGFDTFWYNWVSVNQNTHLVR